ncbi:hypothetical protein C8J57DRAFT_1114049 [Mycena rebaudengoi]|nr:hypothetical protein C8J57DRAFT_1114049 [Mycena rebaudengoi]
MVVQLLDLPPELILGPLLYLSSKDLSSCMRTGNRFLRDIIQNSVLIQYMLELDLAAVEENPKRLGGKSVSDRLAALRDRESAWLNFEHSTPRDISLDFDSSGIYDLTSDVYFVGDAPAPGASCTGVRYIHTSPSHDGGSQWTTIDAGSKRSVIDFGTALEEHDLIALVTFTRGEQNSTQMSLDIVLLNLSTGKPHELATNPIIHVDDVDAARNRPGISIEIVGENLALLLVYWDNEETDKDAFHLYNWKLGTPKMAPLRIVNTGVVFLTEEIILIPSAPDESLELDIFYIPPSSQPGEVALITSLALPRIKDSFRVVSFQCRGEPNPRHRPRPAAFAPRPEDAIIVFTFEAWSSATGNHFMFVAHRAALLALVGDPLVALTGNPTEVPWKAWSACTRWLDAPTLSMHFITNTAGQRLAAIPVDAWQTPAPIRVLDFNPAHVAAQRILGPVTTARASIRVVEADENGRGRRRPRGTLDRDGEGDVSTEADGNVSTEAEGNLSMEALELGRIGSKLPYVETVSVEKFSFRAVMMNDENIIGVSYGDTALERLHVLHFG